MYCHNCPLCFQLLALQRLKVWKMQRKNSTTVEQRNWKNGETKMSMCFFVCVCFYFVVIVCVGVDKNEYDIVFLGVGVWGGDKNECVCVCVCFLVNKCQRWILPGQACSCLQTAAIIFLVGSEISVLLTNLVGMENWSLYRALWAVRFQFCWQVLFRWKTEVCPEHGAILGLLLVSITNISVFILLLTNPFII